MNNKQIAAAFVSMCNGTQEKKTVNGRNNLSIRVVGDKLALYSYYTPIAVYNGTFVVVNASSYSAATAKHQSHICRHAFNCPVSVICHFAVFGCTCSELLEQAAPLYSVQKQTLEASNGRKYTRFVLKRQARPTDDAEARNFHCYTIHRYTIHRYASEQAAVDEMHRLNILACGQLTNL